MESASLRRLVGGTGHPLRRGARLEEIDQIGKKTGL